MAGQRFDKHSFSNPKSERDLEIDQVANLPDYGEASSDEETKGTTEGTPKTATELIEEMNIRVL